MTRLVWCGRQQGEPNQVYNSRQAWDAIAFVERDTHRWEWWWRWRWQLRKHQWHRPTRMAQAFYPRKANICFRGAEQVQWIRMYCLPLWKSLKVNNSNFLSLLHIKKTHFFCIYEFLWRVFPPDLYLCLSLSIGVCEFVNGFQLISHFLCSRYINRTFFPNPHSVGNISAIFSPFALTIFNSNANCSVSTGDKCKQKDIHVKIHTYIVVAQLLVIVNNG